MNAEHLEVGQVVVLRGGCWNGEFCTVCSVSPLKVDYKGDVYTIEGQSLVQLTPAGPMAIEAAQREAAEEAAAAEAEHEALIKAAAERVARETAERAAARSAAEAEAAPSEAHKTISAEETPFDAVMGYPGLLQSVCVNLHWVEGRSWRCSCTTAASEEIQYKSYFCPGEKVMVYCGAQCVRSCVKAGAVSKKHVRSIENDRK